MFNTESFNNNRYNKAFNAIPTDTARIEKIVNLVGSNKNVLDIGCWDGTIAELITKANNKVKGIEISDEARKIANSKGIETFKLDLTADWASSINEQFDIVVAGEIIEHVFDTDLFLENIKKVLKPNGELVLSTPNVASLGRRIMLLLGKNPNLEFTTRVSDSGHIRYFTMRDLVNLLEEHHFKVISKTASLVNFSKDGSISSKYLADKLPTLGTTLIIRALNVK